LYVVKVANLILNASLQPAVATGKCKVAM
jgi:hypothetical protein